MTLSLTCDALRWLAFPGLRDNIILTRHILFTCNISQKHQLGNFRLLVYLFKSFEVKIYIIPSFEFVGVI